ncbi:hypothetical protein evm_004614 [Chilo suppressalis]|nr:hypothetical protein evm_004614 [Chilo suppressalis]
MSPSTQSRGSFTRGEKCLFVHVVVTFTLVLALVVAYFCHLCLVRHHAGDQFRVTRRKAGETGKEVWGQVCAGVVSVGARAACGCVALRARWSVAPARCVAAQNHPSLASLLLTWNVRYLPAEGYNQETGIVKGIVHTHFNKDNSKNDIGLFQHKHSIDIEPYRYIGAALVVGTQVIGFFTWGDKHGSLPMVMLNLAHFSDWIENIVNE